MKTLDNAKLWEIATTQFLARIWILVCDERPTDPPSFPGWRANGSIWVAKEGLLMMFPISYDTVWGWQWEHGKNVPLKEPNFAEGDAAQRLIDDRLYSWKVDGASHFLCGDAFAAWECVEEREPLLLTYLSRRLEITWTAIRLYLDCYRKGLSETSREYLLVDILLKRAWKLFRRLELERRKAAKIASDTLGFGAIELRHLEDSHEFFQDV